MIIIIPFESDAVSFKMMPTIAAKFSINRIFGSTIRTEAGFYILRHTICPAVLTENLFMDNANDVAFLQSHSGKEAITMLHVEGIREYLCG